MWAVQPSASRHVIPQLRGILSPNEQVRATRFRFERDRLTYITGRGALRTLLGDYLDRPPATIPITTTPYDKPILASPDASLTFNVSHSGDLVLLAFADQVAVGVDVEPIRPIPDADDIVARFFSDAEVQTWRALPPAQRDAAFLTCWTRKEAYIKARGEGLSHPLHLFDVAFRPNEPARLLASRSSDAPVDDWSLHALPLPAPYVGALAVRDPSTTLSLFRLSW